jgi:ADP-ribose pyrophosphatase YjhB (NUDIX family)
MHRHQHEILCRLADLGAARYGSLKPKSLEGNVFVYHLQAVQRAGLVEKNALVYNLSLTGLEYVDRLGGVMRQPRIQPKIVTLTACQNEDGKWLFYRRAREPFRGRVGFPYGKIHLGERVQEAAERELLHKTGVTAQLRHLGEAYITVYAKQKLVAHMLCHVFVGAQVQGELKEQSSIGECFWADLQDLASGDRFPGLNSLYTLVEEGLPFSLQEFVEQLNQPSDKVKV